MPKKFVSKEAVAKANQINIVDYFKQHEPHELQSIGKDEYRLKSHDSFRISKNKWYWNSQNITGDNALSYLVKAQNMDFISAVEFLTSDLNLTLSTPQNTPSIKDPVSKENPILPPPNDNNDIVIKYLESRGLDKGTVQQFIDNGSLYQSKNFNACVFVGKDQKSGQIKYAAIRATTSNFRQEVKNSQKIFPFCSVGTSNSVEVYESPIDLMSSAAIDSINNLDNKNHKISSGGVASSPITSYLAANPHINHVILCFDNDTAGRSAAEKSKALLIEKGITVDIKLPIHGKDYNEQLVYLRKNAIKRSPFSETLAEKKSRVSPHKESKNTTKKEPTV